MDSNEWLDSSVKPACGRFCSSGTATAAVE
jgi:hypothetical protein